MSVDDKVMDVEWSTHPAYESYHLRQGVATFERGYATQFPRDTHLARCKHGVLLSKSVLSPYRDNCDLVRDDYTVSSIYESSSELGDRMQLVIVRVLTDDIACLTLPTLGDGE